MKKLFAGLIGLSLALTGCLGIGEGDEKQAFIDATVEATCLIFQADDIFDPALEAQAKEVYENHGFDANDDDAMETLTTKYEDDEDVQDAIAAALESCAGDKLKGLEEAFGSLSEDSVVSEDEAVVAEDEATESEEEAAE